MTRAPFGLVASTRAVNFPLERFTPNPQILSIFRAWVLAFMDETPVEQMWVPLGRVGPVLMIGHAYPEGAPEPGFPLWPFSLVRISPELHQQLASVLGDALNATDSGAPFSAAMISNDAPLWGENPRREALEMLLHFPGSEADAAGVQRVLENAATEGDLFAGLPPGWVQAVHFLTQNVPLLDLAQFTPSAEVSAALPNAFAAAHDLVPVSLENGTLVLASPKLATGTAQAELKAAWLKARPPSLGETPISLTLCAPADRAAYESRRRIAVPDLAKVIPVPVPPRSIPQSTSRRGSGASGSTVKAYWTLLKRNLDGLSIDSPALDAAQVLHLAMYRAIGAGASDLHIDFEGGAGRMRVRLDGIMRLLGPGRFALLKLRPVLQLLRTGVQSSDGDLSPVDGKFSLQVDDKYFDVRVSILPEPNASVTGLGYAVLRFLPKDSRVRELSELKLDPDDYSVLFHTLDKPNGLVLLTGPTGSGKTTTLNSMIHTLNRGLRPGEEGTLKILTAEDPVEYTIDGVSQISVNKQVGFAEAVRRFLRQDPDVILVGEIRDRETAQAAIEAARTGHLVFSTLHTNGAAETVARFYGMKIEPFELDGTLLTLAAQRLLPQLCPHCKVQVAPSAEDRAVFDAAGEPCPETLFEATPTGCEKCERGFRGRIAVLEIVRVTRAINAAIARGASEHELRTLSREAGFLDLHRKGLRKAAQGYTSLRVALGHLNSGWE